MARVAKVAIKVTGAQAETMRYALMDYAQGLIDGWNAVEPKDTWEGTWMAHQVNNVNECLKAMGASPYFENELNAFIKSHGIEL